MAAPYTLGGRGLLSLHQAESGPFPPPSHAFTEGIFAMPQNIPPASTPPLRSPLHNYGQSGLRSGPFKIDAGAVALLVL